MTSALMMTEPTMLSVEIAALCEKEHRNVMRDIRQMLTVLHGEGGVLSFEQSYLNEQNKEQPCFRLPKRETLILVSGYRIDLRAKIIDRWQELETQTAPKAISPANMSRLDLIKMAMVAEEERLLLECRVEAMMPQVAAFTTIAEKAEGSMCITNAAKYLQMQPKKLFAYLSAEKWIYRRVGGGGWVAYQDKLQSGYLEHKITTVERSDGSEKIIENVLVTAKGLAKLALKLGVQPVEV